MQQLLRSLSTLLSIMLLTSCSGEGKEKVVKSLSDNTSEPSNSLSKAFGNGRIESEMEILQLASPTAGILTKILKQENQLVKKGEALAEFEKSAEEAEITRVLAKIKAERKQNEIDSEKIREAEKRVSKAYEAFERSKRLIKLEAETQEAYEDASLKYDVEKSKLNNAFVEKSASLSEIEALYAELEIARANRNKKVIVAPKDGKILEWKISQGEGTQATNTIAQFAPEGKLIAVCEIDELLAGELRLGQKAVMRTQGSRASISEGEIVYLSGFLKRKSIFGDSSAEAEDRRVRIVKISLKSQKNLLINSRIQCEISLDNL